MPSTDPVPPAMPSAIPMRPSFRTAPLAPALLLGGLLLGACAPSQVAAPAPGHPASPDVQPGPATVEVAALAPAPPPDLPVVLRPDGHPPAGSMVGMDPSAVEGAMDHAAMDHEETAGHDGMATMGADDASMSHTAMNHGRTVFGTPSPTPPERLGDVPPAPVSMDTAPTPLTQTLDAYLVLHDALASDQLDAAAAQSFAAAFDRAVAEAPADDPHLWHARMDEVEAVRAAAAALAGAGDLAAARVAFGEMSVPFVALVRAHGVPAGYDLARFTCGMAQDVPEGGVWMQRDGELRNPYFGAAMLTCGRRDGGLPPMDNGNAGHHMGSSGMGSGDMDSGEMKTDGTGHDGYRP